jgi:hypothetical protein
LLFVRRRQRFHSEPIRLRTILLGIGWHPPGCHLRREGKGESMTEQQYIERLIKTLEAYKAYRSPLDLTETDLDTLMDALRTKINLIEFLDKYRDDGK